MLDKRLKKAVMSLSRFPQVKWVKLFGSRARGDNSEHSDYDLAVYIDNDSAWFDVKEALESELLLPLDVIDYKNAIGDIKAHIDTQGMVVFLNEKWFISLSSLGDALATLEDVIGDENDERNLIRDSVLTRFKYIIEIFWKSFKHLQESQGDEEVKFPRDAIARAYQVGWIDNDKKWIQMLKDRNNISHSYKEDLANEIYKNIKDNFPELKSVYGKLKVKFIDNLEV